MEYYLHKLSLVCTFFHYWIIVPPSLLHIPELSRRNKSYVEYANSKGECSR